MTGPPLCAWRRDERGESKVLGVLLITIFIGTCLFGAWLQQPTTPNPGAPACDEARTGLETSTLKGAARRRLETVEATFAAFPEDDASERAYRGVRCVIGEGEVADDSRLSVYVVDTSTRDIAVSIPDDDGAQRIGLPSGTPGERAVLTTQALQDVRSVLLVFSSGRFVVYVLALETQSTVTVKGLTDQVLERGRTIEAALSPLPDLDLDRRLRDELAVSWGGVLAVVVILGLVLTATRDQAQWDRAIGGVMGSLGRLLRVADEPPPGMDLRPGLRRVRRLRLFAGLVGLVALTLGFQAFVRVLPTGLGIIEVSAYAGVGFAAIDLVRTTVLGSFTRFAYLRAADARAKFARLLLLVLEGVSAGAVVYGCARVAIAWEQLAFFGLDANSGREDARVGIGVLLVNAMFGPIVLVAVGLVWRFARVRLNWRSESLLDEDLTRKVVLLRSFVDDDIALRTHWSVFHPLHAIFDPDRTESFEDVLVRQLWQVGPVTAFGRPGTTLRPLGAVRTWHDMETWKDDVLDEIDTSRLIVVVAGPTASLSWEIGQLKHRDLLARTVIIFPPVYNPDHVRARIRRIADSLNSSAPWSAYRGDQTLVALRFGPDGAEVAAYVDTTDDLAYREVLEHFALTDHETAARGAAAAAAARSESADQALAAARHDLISRTAEERAQKYGEDQEASVREAVEHARLALRCWRRADDRESTAAAALRLADLLLTNGDHAEAETAYGVALADCRDAGTVVSAWRCRAQQVDLRWSLGAPPDRRAADLAHLVRVEDEELGERLFEQALAAVRGGSAPDRWQEAFVIRQRAEFARRADDPSRALAFEAEADLLTMEAGNAMPRRPLYGRLTLESRQALVRARRSAVEARVPIVSTLELLHAVLLTDGTAKELVLPADNDLALAAERMLHRLGDIRTFGDHDGLEPTFDELLQATLVEAVVQADRRGSASITLTHLAIGVLVVAGWTKVLHGALEPLDVAETIAAWSGTTDEPAR